MLKFESLIIIFLAASLGWSGQEVANHRTGWSSDGTMIFFVPTKGIISKKFAFVEKKIPISKEQSSIGNEELIRVVGNVSTNAKYAWLDERHLSFYKAAHKFQYFGSDGEKLWEKNNLYGGTISQNGERMLAAEVELRWLKKNQHGNSPHPVALFNSSGNLIERYPECKSYMDSFRRIPNNRFAIVQCARSSQKGFHYQLIIDLNSGKAKRIEGRSGVEVGDDGTYIMFETKPYFDPETKKYGVAVRKNFKAGSFYD